MSMYSHENPVETTRRLQDECIKADSNFLLTWDQWVPPKLCPTPSPQKDRIPVGDNHIGIRPNQATTSGPPQVTNSKISTMPSKETYTEALPMNNFGHEVFEMYWNTEADQVPKAGSPTATPSAEPQVGGQHN
ncbi:uncharacterized protein F5891DRAFT_1198407 [Suillus fuscotomentosus]|uniref:Uncharacterized protein n=1 Tax=Suillus fuscotomentosus TaxID=1912939 RepID=A0AAD4DQN5_9AGAM|nr:uncharacterized protein F5891DRAFT_1198407 [Suillus fuscotomentosus]KAG1889744.1 hypothetical protein F5891DRAFT_1198407 [Suillus fuscotomentosus]